MITPVILAGGLGTRLWPVSRPAAPKPLVQLDGPLSMLQQTVLRAGAVPGASRPVIVCGETHYPLIAAQLDGIGQSTYVALLEPEGRGTAPATAAAALASRRQDLLLVMPADHVIQDLEAFVSVIVQSGEAARTGRLVTFGITPERPETGYGYIERGDPITEAPGSYRIASFREKPDPTTALRYVESGRYWWNSGMFLFTAGAFLDELRRFAPEMVLQAESALRGSENRATGVEGRRVKLLEPDSFRACPHGSIDRTVMERTMRGAIVPLSAGWNDVGTWAALWDTGSKDEHGNVVSGSVLMRDVSSSYLRAGGRVVVVLGLDRVIVVDAGDAVLVAGMDHAQAVKDIARALPVATEPEPEPPV